MESGPRDWKKIPHVHRKLFKLVFLLHLVLAALALVPYPAGERLDKFPGLVSIMFPHKGSGGGGV